MEDQPAGKGRPGRRVKEEGRPKTGVMTFRVRQGMRERLQASAEARDLSISEEVERRLDLSLDMALDPFKTIALRMIVERWKVIDALVEVGGSLEDPSIYAKHAEQAVLEALSVAGDASLMKSLTNQKLSQFYSGNNYRKSISDIVARNDGDIRAASDEMADGIQQGAIWEHVNEGPDPPKKTKAEREQEARQAAARKANTDLVSLTPERMDEMFGPPGTRRRPKSKT